MLRCGTSRLVHALTAAAGLVLGLGVADHADAQTGPQKTPGGPYVVRGNPLWSVEAGRDIQWTVTATNFSPTPYVAAFVDGPQGNWLPPGPAGELECESRNEQRAWQPWLYFPDEDGDGQCEPGVQVLDGAGNPLTVSVSCDTATQILDIRGINVPAFGNVSITFRTRVDAGALVGATICNWGHIYAPEPPAPPNQVQHTWSYSETRVPSCTCLLVAPPSGFDISVNKTATITAPGGRLVPGADTSTIQYAITATNTGGTDISGASFTDTVGGATVADGRGLQWVTIDDCPTGLSCTLNPAGTQLRVTNINLPSVDPDASVTVLATAKVTCEAATNTDDGRVCNQADFTAGGVPGTFPSDDPDTPVLGDPTCVPVVWSDLTTTRKFMEFDVADDTNGNGSLDVNELVTVRVRARNAGRLTARNVVVTDDVGATTCLDPARITAISPTPDSVAGGVITWSVGDLAPLGGSRDVTFKAPLVADALCCNQASVQSDERIGCGQGPIQSDDDFTSEDPVANPPEPTCISPGPQPDLRIEKTVELAPGGDQDGDGEIDAGDTVHWTVVITNEGLGTASAARFRDPLSICLRFFPGASGVTVTPAGAGDPSCSVAAAMPLNPGTACVSDLGGADGLQPGESVRIEWDTVAGATTGCCNQGEVTYAESNTAAPSDDPGTPGLVDDPTCILQPPCEPTGRLEKRVELLLDGDLDGRLETGEQIEYLLTFANVGCGDLTNVRIQDVSQACLALDPTNITIEPPTGVTNNSTATDLDLLIAGPLAPTESVTIRMRATGAAPSPNCCNQATWSAPDGAGGTISGLSDYDVTDFSPEMPTCNEWLVPDTPPGSPDIDIVKQVLASGCLDPGALITYQISLTNVGDGAAATFTVTDVLPAGVDNVTVTPPLTYDGGTNTVSVTGGPLAALGGRELYTFTATAPCTGAGTVTNTASVQYTDATGPVRREDADDGVQYGLPDLTTSLKTRTVNAGANGVLEPGEFVDFTITVRNSGTCDARDVAVSDQFDLAFDLSGATIGQGGYVSGVDTVKWDGAVEPALSRVAPGASVDLTVRIPVAAGVVTETRVTNAASIVARGHDLALCGLSQPSASPAAPEVCISCAAPVTLQDLLVNRDVTSRATALTELASAVFNNASPNAQTCGETGLDVATDVFQTDIGPTLATGVVVPAASAMGTLVLFEVSERCQTDEGGTDQPICIRKSRATGDITVVLCP